MRSQMISLEVFLGDVPFGEHVFEFLADLDRRDHSRAMVWL